MGKPISPTVEFEMYTSPNVVHDDHDDRYCDHEYDSYCGRCGLHIDGEDD